MRQFVVIAVLFAAIVFPATARAELYCFGSTARPATSFCFEAADECSNIRQGMVDRGRAVTARCTRAARAFCYSYTQGGEPHGECAQTLAHCRANQAEARGNNDRRDFTACQAMTEHPDVVTRRAFGSMTGTVVTTPRANKLTAPSSRSSSIHVSPIDVHPHRHEPLEEAMRDRPSLSYSIEVVRTGSCSAVAKARPTESFGASDDAISRDSYPARHLHPSCVSTVARGDGVITGW